MTRFRFVVAGRAIVGPVQGAGGLVGSLAQLEAAARRAAAGRASGLYEPRPGHVLVFPRCSARTNGPGVVVPLSALVGPAAGA